ncbi:Cellulose synthase operon protein C precursor [Raoultella planticola]|nr:Cellulose synthase operon protein C precursor [Raoultella planticola]
MLGLGDVAAARKDNAAAERYYQRTLRMDRGNNLAVRGLANLYRAQSPEKASAYIAGLSPAQRRSIDDIERSLTNERLEKQAAALESQSNWAQAAEVQRRRLALDPDSVWITYRLSRDLVSAGEQAQADTLMRNMVSRKPGDAERVYAWGLYLSGNNQDDLALAQLAALPRSQWTDNIRELDARLQSDKVIRQANQLRDSGQEAQAIALIQQQPPLVRYQLTLADWAQQRGDSQTAIAQYNAVLSKEADNGDARLGLAEVYLAEGDKNAARAQVSQLKGGETDSINMQRRVALANAGFGDTTQAQQIFNRIIPQAKAQPPSMESALVLRDAARFQTQNGQPQMALESYKDAMVASGVTPVRPQDNDAFTRLTRNNSGDDWLKRGIRSDAADLYRQQDLNVTLEHDFWGSSGTGGYSDLKAHTTMLHVDAPLADGRMFFRTDLVNMDAGSFSTNSDGSYSPNWGTCGEIACTSGSKNQTDGGASVAVGWKNETWSADIGTTPMGFNVVDVVGGLSYSNDLGPIGYTLNMHRRPVSSSLLAFGGQKDSSSHTGITWGGVRADGGGVSMSYDKGEANGVWSSLGVDRLTGKNVADNWRVRWMTGYYYKVINEDNRRVTVGLNNMLWHYDKDLSGYTLGQGGYYSPQEYISFAVPVTWRQRTENWSWELGGSVSWSHSRTKTMPRYPLLNLIPSDYRADASQLTEQGSSSQGFGYTARALVERRVTGNWFVGAAVDIQQAKDYTPSHALLYVRYSAAGWQGDMDMPPQPLVPYADW